jgi:hypothetical protein
VISYPPVGQCPKPPEKADQKIPCSHLARRHPRRLPEFIHIAARHPGGSGHQLLQINIPGKAILVGDIRMDGLGQIPAADLLDKRTASQNEPVAQVFPQACFLLCIALRGFSIGFMPVIRVGQLRKKPRGLEPRRWRLAAGVGPNFDVTP